MSDAAMRGTIESRLQELRREFDYGQSKLQESELQAADLRQKLLQISGAITVLEELLGGSAGVDSTNGAEPVGAPNAPPGGDS